MTRPLIDNLEAARFTRTWWLRKMRSVFWIALVTVLVWVYADMEFTDDVELRARLVVATGKGNRLELLSAPTADVAFVVRGNRASVDRFRRVLGERGSVIHYRIPDTYGPGEHQLRVVDDILLRHAELLQAGLTPLSASPNAVRVQLDRLRTEMLPVEFDHAGAQFVDEPVVRPDKVAIQVAESRWDEIPPSVPRVLKTVPLDLKNEPTGVEIRRELELVRVIGGVKVKPERETVTVTFTIAQRTEPRTVLVAVQLVTPPAWVSDGTWDEYELKRQDELAWRRQITVSGAKKDLDKLHPQDIHAYVVLTEDDKRPIDSWLERTVVIHLPEGLSLKLIGEPPSVKFKLAKRPVPGGS